MCFLIPPVHRFANQPLMANLRYPRKPETVPTWSVGVVAVLLPFLIFLVYYFKNRSIRDFQSAFFGLATAIVVTALFTDSIKNLVGMLRPDLYHHFPSGKAVYTADEEARVICDPAVVGTRAFPDAYKSFPSGHVAWAFAGLGYLLLYLAGKMGLFEGV